MNAEPMRRGAQPPQGRLTGGGLPSYPDFDGTQNCARVDPAVFFPGPGDPALTEAGIHRCTGCPFIEPCLAYALARPQIVGIWGGTSEHQRAAARRRKAAS